MKIRSPIAAAIVFTAALAPFSSRADILTWTYAPSSKDDHGAKTIDGVTITPTYSWVDSTETSFAWTDSSLQIGVKGKAAYGVSYSIPASSFDGGITKVTLTAKVASALHNAGDASKAKVSVSVGGIALSPATTNLTSTATAYEFTSETALSGEMVLSISSTLPKNNSTSYALYVRSIVVTYDDSPSSGGGDTPAGPTALATPTDLATFSITDSGFTLSWTGDENADGYEVEVLDGQNASAGSVSGSVSPSGTVVTGLLSDTTYTVRVKALAAGEAYENSEWSESISVETMLEEGLERATLLDEGFGGMASYASWGGQAFLNEEGDVEISRTDTDTWHGCKLYNAPSSIRFGNANNHGWIQSPAIELANNLPSASVRVTFSAMALHANAQSALVFSVLDADGNTLVIAGVSPAAPTLPLVSSPTSSSSVASELANVGASQQSFKFQAPTGFKLKFDTTAAGNSNVAIDDIVVTQVVDPDCTSLAAPEVSVSGATTDGFSVSWTETADADGGYEVEVLDGEDSVVACEIETSGRSATVSGLSAATQYTVRVRAVGDNLHHSPSPWASSAAQTQALSYDVEFTVSGFSSGSSVYAGNAVSFTVTAVKTSNGGDSEDVTSQLATTFSSGAFSAATGAFSWTPDESDVGTAVIPFQVEVNGSTFAETVVVDVLSNYREVTLFEEGFSNWMTAWTGNSDVDVPTVNTDNHLWTGAGNLKRAHSALRLGVAAAYNSATTPEIFALDSETASDVVLRFKTASVTADARLAVTVRSVRDGTVLMSESVSIENRVSGSDDIATEDVEFTFAPPSGPFTVTFAADEAGNNGRIGIDSVRLFQRVSAHSSASVLAAPTGVSATDPAPDGFSVSWNAVDGASGYEVRVYGEDGVAVSPTPAVSVDAGTCTAAVSGLTPNAKYHVKVRALAPSGSTTVLNGNLSAAAASVTTLRRPTRIAIF